MKKDRLTALQIQEGEAEIARMRKMLGNEMDLLLEETDQPRLLAYVAIQLAVSCAQRGGMSPGQFCALTSDVVALMCGEQDRPVNLRRALEAGE